MSFAGLRALFVEEDPRLQPGVPASRAASAFRWSRATKEGTTSKLALDLNVADIFARLAADGDRPVVSGFVIGAADRRYRAQLNIVRAPISESEVLLAFVSGG